MLMKRLLRLIIFAVLLFVPFVYYVEHRIHDALNDLQQHIETRALPVLQKDIPILNKSLFGIPSARSILSYIKLGPLSPAKLTQTAVGFIEQPIIKMKLEETRKDLNKELGWVKINDLKFARDGKYKTLTAHCSYGITVIITGKHFKKITNRNCERLTLTFICD